MKTEKTRETKKREKMKKKEQYKQSPFIDFNFLFFELF